MAKVTVDYLDLGNGGMAYNYNHLGYWRLV